VPAGLTFHKADALPLDGVGEDHDGSACCRACLLQSVDNLAHVVAVDAQHVPAKCRVLGGERFYLHHVFDQAVDLQAVAINHGDDVVEMKVAGLHRRFPHLALLLLAVAHQAEDLVLPAIDAGGERHPDRDAEPLAEGAGGDFDAGQPEPVRMPLKG